MKEEMKGKQTKKKEKQESRNRKKSRKEEESEYGKTFIEKNCWKRPLESIFYHRKSCRTKDV